MNIDFALILCVSAVCTGISIDAGERGRIVKQAATTLVEASDEHVEHHIDKARRQNSWDATTGQLTTVNIDSDGNSFELSMHSCLGHSIPIGTYINHQGKTKKGATLGYIHDDAVRTRRVASIGTNAAGSNAGKADAASIALVKRNAQAAYDAALDFMNYEILCPGIDDSHDELRKLLQSTANFYRAVVYKSLVAGTATTGVTWFLDNRPNTTFFTRRSIIAGSIAASVVFAHGILDDVARRDGYTSSEATVLNAISSWLSQLADKARAAWEDLKEAAVECFTLDEANQNAANFPGVVDPQLGIDNNIPEGQIPPNQGFEQNEQPADCIV